MIDERPPASQRFEDDLDRMLHGVSRLPERSTDEADTAELATARLLATHFASLRHPSAELQDRIWRQTQARIGAAAQDRILPMTSTHPLLAFPRQRLVAVAAAVLLLLNAITPIGTEVAASAQELLEAVGWVEQAPSPGDESTAVEIDGGDRSELVGAPTVEVDAVTVPYDPNVRDQIEPRDASADDAAPDPTSSGMP